VVDRLDTALNVNKRHFIVNAVNMKQDKIAEWKVSEELLWIVANNLYVECVCLLQEVHKTDYRNELCGFFFNVFLCLLFARRMKRMCHNTGIRTVLWMRLAQMLSILRRRSNGKSRFLRVFLLRRS